MILTIEIAAGVVLGLVVFHYLKNMREGAELDGFLYRNSPAHTPLCEICGHPSAYHKRDEYSGTSSCTHCTWYETDGKKHGWDERRRNSADNGFMKEGDYSAIHNFHPEKKGEK